MMCVEGVNLTILWSSMGQRHGTDLYVKFWEYLRKSNFTPITRFFPPVSCVSDHGVCECTCERMHSLPQTHLSLKWDTSHTHALLTLPTHTHHSHHTHITCLQVALYPCLLEHDLNQIVNWIVDDLMTMPLRTITRQCEVNIEDTTCVQSTSGCKEGGIRYKFTWGYSVHLLHCNKLMRFLDLYA